MFGGSLADPTSPDAVQPAASADRIVAPTLAGKRLVDLLA